MPTTPAALRRLRNLGTGLFLTAATSLILWWTLTSLGDDTAARFFAGVGIGATLALGLCSIGLVWILVQARLTGEDDQNPHAGLTPQKVPVRNHSSLSSDQANRN